VSNTGIFHGVLKNNPNYKYLIDKNATLNELSLDDIASQKVKIKPKFIVTWKDRKAAISCWVSAKRTRSYPYTRIFNTLSQKDIKKITIFPILKDEGLGTGKHKGCFDLIQWDTFSMCTYLGVYTIPAYYVKARRNQSLNKVRCQEFDYAYLTEKIKEILTTSNTVKEWNNIQRNSIKELEDRVIKGYGKIAKETGVTFRSQEHVRKVLRELRNPDTFKSTSQKKSKRAQDRENQTTQPKEEVFGMPKGKVTLEDSLGGKYTWTVDAYHIENKNVYLIEMKHRKGGIPTLGDIEDALLKFHFYANLSELRDENGIMLKPKPSLVLSSGKDTFDKISNAKYVKLVLEEAKLNNILVIISGKGETKKNLIQKLLSN
jgi:hypothetical protein